MNKKRISPGDAKSGYVSKTILRYLKNTGLVFIRSVFIIAIVLAICNILNVGAYVFYDIEMRNMKNSIKEFYVRPYINEAKNIFSVLSEKNVASFKQLSNIANAYVVMDNIYTIKANGIEVKNIQGESTIPRHPSMNSDVLYVGTAIQKEDGKEIVITKGLLKKIVTNLDFTRSNAMNYLGQKVEVTAHRTVDGIIQAKSMDFSISGILNDNREGLYLSFSDSKKFRLWIENEIDSYRTDEDLTSYDALLVCLDRDKLGEISAFRDNYSIYFKSIYQNTNKGPICDVITKLDMRNFTRSEYQSIKRDIATLSADPYIIINAEDREGNQIKLEAAFENLHLNSGDRLTAINLLKMSDSNSIVLPRNFFEGKKDPNMAEIMARPYRIKHQKSGGEFVNIDYRIVAISDIDRPLIKPSRARDLVSWKEGEFFYDNEINDFNIKETKENTNKEVDVIKAAVIVKGDLDDVEDSINYFENVLHYRVDANLEVIKQTQKMFDKFIVGGILGIAFTVVIASLSIFAATDESTKQMSEAFVVMRSLGATRSFLFRFFVKQCNYITAIVLTVSIILTLGFIAFIKTVFLRGLDTGKITVNLFTPEAGLIVLATVAILYTMCFLASYASYDKIKKMDMAKAFKNF